MCTLECAFCTQNECITDCCIKVSSLVRPTTGNKLLTASTLIVIYCVFNTFCNMMTECQIKIIFDFQYQYCLRSQDLLLAFLSMYVGDFRTSYAEPVKLSLCLPVSSTVS
jgi:hypothetical protein